MSTTVVHKLEDTDTIYATTVMAGDVRMIHWNFGKVGIMFPAMEVHKIRHALLHPFDVDAYHARVAAMEQQAEKDMLQ